MGRLDGYVAKRDVARSGEPAGKARPRSRPRAAPRFVVQEHHARRLHWDFRLEREGVLVSWAVPKGIPDHPRRNHLAVHVEDHPLEYIGFAGRIPAGSYGAGTVSLWDQGTYEVHKWEMGAARPEVQVTLHGNRVEGRYALFQTEGRNWMIHRMDPPASWPASGVEPLPGRVQPMMARLADALPQPEEGWAFEFKWDGIRALAFVNNGEVRLVSRSQEDVTARYPELGGLAEALGRARRAVLDGEIVALGPSGTPSFEQLQQRMGLRSDAEVRSRMREVPVVYMIFDLIHLDGGSTTALPYLERRRRLAELALASPSWQTPEHRLGDGEAMLAGSAQAGLEGIMAKRVDSRYEAGRRSASWLKVKNRLRQELVIGGWLEGAGRRRGWPGALLVGYMEGGELVYAGKVGTGFTDQMLGRLAELLGPLERSGSPFARGRPPRAARFVEPRLVGEFAFVEWTRGGQLRAPAFKGLREDKDPAEVVRELGAR